MTRPQRWSCWPRGRKTWTASSRQFQAIKASWLDSQGKDGTRTAFTEMATALGRRCELVGATTTTVVKTKEEKRRWRRLGTYSAAQKLKEATMELFPCQRDIKDGHDAPGTPKKVRRQCSLGGEHCSQKLQNCHTPKFTNYSQIFITTQKKSPKTKVVQNRKFYNFASITIS